MRKKQWELISIPIYSNRTPSHTLFMATMRIALASLPIRSSRKSLRAQVIKKRCLDEASRHRSFFKNHLDWVQLVYHSLNGWQPIYAVTWIARLWAVARHARQDCAAAGVHGIYSHLSSEGPEENNFNKGSHGDQDIQIVHEHLRGTEAANKPMDFCTCMNDAHKHTHTHIIYTYYIYYDIIR